MTVEHAKIHEDGLPGHEAKMDRKPDFMPRYDGSERLAGKSAIITGGDSGIGRAVAVLYAREGANVTIVHLEEDDDAAETARHVEAEGRRCLIIRGDVGDKKFCEDIVRRHVEAFGGLDILVNNAGEQHPDKEITDVAEEQLKRTFQTNFFGYFFMAQAAVPHLKAGSSIINCTSVTSFEGSEELLDYSSTKGAITSFTRALSGNLAKKGIRVNGVAPGPIWTPLNPCGGASEEKMKSFGENTPMGRPGEPWEVAPSFLFLACDDGSYFTGQILSPNGGTIVGA
jgi:NAD(P)-dependent dehydrogenase (short-subunit alcohol dehydrogenase family)